VCDGEIEVVILLRSSFLIQNLALISLKSEPPLLSPKKVKQTIRNTSTPLLFDGVRF